MLRHDPALNVLVAEVHVGPSRHDLHVGPHVVRSRCQHVDLGVGEGALDVLQARASVDAHHGDVFAVEVVERLVVAGEPRMESDRGAEVDERIGEVHGLSAKGGGVGRPD